MQKQAIIVRTDLEMGKGKTCSQVAHASLQSYMKTKEKNPEWAEQWTREGQKKIVLKVSSKKELEELFKKVRTRLPCSKITDAGHTQIEPGTVTAVGIGPAPEGKIDQYTSKYKLL